MTYADYPSKPALLLNALSYLDKDIDVDFSSQDVNKLVNCLDEMKFISLIFFFFFKS